MNEGEREKNAVNGDLLPCDCCLYDFVHSRHLFFFFVPFAQPCGYLDCRHDSSHFIVSQHLCFKIQTFKMRFFFV